MEKEIKATVTVTAKDLSCFMLQHTYRSVGGVLSLLFSIGAFGMLLYCFTTVDFAYKAVLVISSLLFTVINPLLLCLRAGKQVRRNPGFRIPISYTFTKRGFTMEQGEEKVSASWSDLWRIREGRKYFYLYGSSVRANIVPKSQLNGQAQEISQLIKESRKKA